jgi:hypothetical protein
VVSSEGTLSSPRFKLTKPRVLEYFQEEYDGSLNSRRIEFRNNGIGIDTFHSYRRVLARFGAEMLLVIDESLARELSGANGRPSKGAI